MKDDMKIMVPNVTPKTLIPLDGVVNLDGVLNSDGVLKSNGKLEGGRAMHF